MAGSGSLTSAFAMIVISLVTQFNSYQDDSRIVTLCVSENTTECSTSAFTQMLNCTACKPLSFYIQNSGRYFIDNVEMVFTMGDHCLSPSADGETIINITGVSNFTMKGLGNISYNPSEEGAIQPSSVITCNCSRNKSGILFFKSSGIHIESLTIEDCGAEIVIVNPHLKTKKFTAMGALMFYDSNDITLVRIRMNRNLEHGMFAQQIFGSFTITNSAFLRCIVLSSVFPLNNTGSNVLIEYRNYHHNRTSLSIEHSWFLYGGNKSNGATGLSIFIYRPKFSIIINNVTLMYNTNGNVQIHIDDYHENTSSVTINSSLIAYGSALQGGGLYLRMEALQQAWQLDSAYANASLNVVTVLNTKFKNNIGSDRGGGVFIAYYERSITDTIQRSILFEGCQFICNSIIKGTTLGDGAAVHIYKREIPDIALHMNPLFSFSFIRCIFEYNQLDFEPKEGGVVTFISTNSIIIKDSNFTSNEGTAIFLQNSNVQFSGSVIFANNSALHGGALNFCQSSKMYLPVGSVHIDFINNSATSTGGAIDVKEECTERIPPCFFQPGYQKNVKFSDLNATIRFINNTANLAGDAIYGGQIDRCYMITYYTDLIFKKHHSQTAFEKIFNLTQQNDITKSTISSSPFGACFCNATDAMIDDLHCGNITYGRVSPGQTVSIGVAAVGQRNGTVPISSVYFEFSNIFYESSNTTQLIINNAFQANRPRARCNILNSILYSNLKSATFKLAIQQASPIEISYVNYEPSYLTVLIKECPWGFILSSTPPYKCDCDRLLKNFGIHCNINTQTVTVPGRHYYWLGCSSVNGSNCQGLSLADHCLLGYCKSETITITPLTMDQQCSDGREGVLCGHCKPNYSLALGTSSCLPSCPGYLFYIILVLSATSGVLLILFLIFCDFTISDGTMNGLFFYAHIVHRNTDSFFPLGSIPQNNVFRLFIAWLNLDLGFEICFYKSMSPYQKAWFQSGFIFYLCTLEATIIILSHKYIFFTRLLGRNVVKVLATLFLISCAKMVDIGISSLQFAQIKHSDGPNTVVWLFDGNISYLKGKHIPLFVLGLIFCSLALVYAMVLLFIQCLQRRSNICCLRWVERWRAFLRLTQVLVALTIAFGLGFFSFFG